MVYPHSFHGLRLIELLIVVAIILIIDAIAIPNFMKSKMAANEASAVGSIRTINTSEIAFASACPGQGFTGTIADFATGAATCPGASGLLDSPLVTLSKSGYAFTLASAGATPRTAYTINADPLTASSGTRYFFSDESGVIRYATGGAAVVTSPALQ